MDARHPPHKAFDGTPIKFPIPGIQLKDKMQNKMREDLFLVSRSKGHHLGNRRFVEVQLQSLDDISKVLGMEANHIFGYARMVTPKINQIEF